MVDLSVIPGNYSDPNLLSFTWNCTKITNSYMDIEVTWSNVLEVSALELKESLKVNFIGKKYFMASDG